MNNTKFLFSVVIPVYKVEDYLAETIDSVINQSLNFQKNIEIILVNDGSPDNSGAICEMYQKQYPQNIKYVVKENGGVSSARNLGLKYAEGKYVNFLDSDDKWGTAVFEKVAEFFNKHDGEIDVVSARVRIFDAKSEWHILDYKYQNGTRVVDITDATEYNTIQLHVTSSFFRRDAIQHISFNENIKYGEDALYATSVILKKCKFGLMHDCIHYYRKRPDLSSATQSQSVKIEYYTTSPRLYYMGMIEESIRLYGEVIPYVQNILAYDIGWRVRVPAPEEITAMPDIFENYTEFLKKVLSYVDDKVYLKSKVHKKLGTKLAFFKLKNGYELIEKTSFDVSKKAVMVNDVKLYNFKKANHSACHINICTIDKDTLTIEGLVLKWLLDSCPNDEISFVLRVGSKNFNVKLENYPFIKEVNFFGKEERYFYFKKKIKIPSFINKNGELKIRAALKVNGKICNITTIFGKHVANRKIFKPCYKIFGSYIMICSSKVITISKPENIRLEHLKLEKEAEKWLCENNLNEFAKFRRKCILYKKTVLRGKQLWLISDRFDVANDNAEAFFRYLCENANVDKKILPVFCISKYSRDAKRLSKIGKVVYFEDEKRYKKLYLCADKIISSSGGEFATNPLNRTERIYLTDLIRSKLVFLQHGIIFNDLSAWLYKHNKNINLFITSAKREQESITSGKYLYDYNDVVLTGLARYDNLNNNPEKKIVVLPTWRTSIKGSFNQRSESIYFDKFVETDYYKFYNSLINNERLLKAMREKGYKGLFCLHPIHSKQSVDFDGNDIFDINHGAVNYQHIFSTASVLVTDYSSIFFDFAYLRKPVVFSQFDKESFYEGQVYEEGYFNWDLDSFGPICTDIDSTVDNIISLIENECKIEDIYLERINNFYAFNDKNNCDRIYKAIISK